MRKLILLALLTLIQLSAPAQIVVQLPDTLAGKNYVKNYVRQALKELNAAPVEPKPEVIPVKDCKAGPQLKTILNVTGTSIEARYHGEDVFELYWRVVSGSDTIEAGGVTPVDNHPVLRFSKQLPAANYTLVFIGKSCKGRSTISFVIPKAVGDIPVKDAPNLGWQIKNVTTGLKEQMDLSITGNADQLVISDNASSKLEDNHDYVYLINGQLLRQRTLLKNYTFRPGQALRVLKIKLRSDIKSANQWSENETTYYYSPTAGALFDPNTRIPFFTAVFTSDSKTDASGFLRHIPQSYDPGSGFAQWADIGTDLKLPAGHVFVANRGEWPLELVQKKGVTHIPNGQLPWEDFSAVTRLKDAGLTYNDVPRPEAFLGLNPSGEDKWVNGYNLKFWPDGPLTEQQAIQKADQTDAGHALWISETLEGSSFMPQEQAMWGHFYKRLRERYEQNFGKRGIPYYICHNYFQQWGAEHLAPFNLGYLGREADKRFLSLPSDQLPNTVFSPGGTLSATNLIVEGVYLNAPDIQTGSVYQSIFRLAAYKKMGFEGGVFLFGVHEWYPNNLQKYSYEDGDFYASGKIPLDPNVIITYGFLAHVYGKVYVEWGGAGKGSTKDFSREWQKGYWQPKGGDLQGVESNPHMTDSNNYYTGYTGSSDFSYFSQQLFADSYGLVEGGTDQYLRFRIDGGSWNNAENVNVNDVVNAYYDQRGFVHSRTRNGKTAWFYLNSFADNSAHKLEVILPDGSMATETVSGNGIHVKVI